MCHDDATFCIVIKLEMKNILFDGTFMNMDDTCVNAQTTCRELSELQSRNEKEKNSRKCSQHT